jgi:hypothetical protein
MQYKDFIKETLKILKGIGYSVLFTYYFITIMIDRLIRKITTGIQPKSGKTIFMDKNATNNLGGYFQNPDMATKLEPEIIKGKPTGRANLVLTEDYGPKKTGTILQTVEYSTKPSVGQYPVEIYSSASNIGDTGKGIHFGTQIKKVLKKVPWVGAALTAATSANAEDLVEGFSPIPFGELGNADLYTAEELDKLTTKPIKGGLKNI